MKWRHEWCEAFPDLGGRPECQTAINRRFVSGCNEDGVDSKTVLTFKAVVAPAQVADAGEDIHFLPREAERAPDM